MTRNPLTIAVNRAIAGAFALALTHPALAQEPDQGALTQLDAVAVQGQIVYRDRTAATAPVLVYDLSYFQRFEPLTVGDMLKRVPSVAFVSDVLEYDGVRLRGLDPGYTQILINGKKVPGAGNDRSIFVDRIPAELVERIEIIRNTSANRSGDAVAGAINIVMRDAEFFEGAYVRAGALYFDDGELKGTGGAVISGDVGAGRLLAGVNVQGRYNPKEKTSLRFAEPDGEFVDREDQSDTRDGTDYSANLSYVQDVGDSGRLDLSAFFVQTDRTETEQSFEYNDRDSRDRNSLLSVNDQVEDIDQSNYAFGIGYQFDALGGSNAFKLDYSAFDDDTDNTEEEVGYDDDDTPPSFDALEGTRELSEISDEELLFSYEHKRPIGEAELSIGFDYADKQRDAELRVSEVETDEEGAALPPYDEFDLQRSDIDEQRIDPYLMLAGKSDTFAWEAGLRYETTDVDVRFDEERDDNDYAELLPSAHLKWDLSDENRVSLSLGRTLRRPNFDFILPLTLEGEYGDNDFTGNPGLDPESAWGIDFGFERRLGRDGVVGINFFYRDVQDLIELVNTGDPSDEAIGDFEDEVAEFLDENPGATPDTPGYPQFDPDSFVYSADNVGDGEVWGVEFDLSAPLTVFDMPNTGVFINYSWLDSEVEDAFGKRRFNNQAHYVYNLGFIHDIPDHGWSFGMSYRKQGDAESRVLAEEVRTEYDADLEAFIEKRFSADFAVRLTGSNLLDASKDEYFRKFDNEADQADRDYDEFEVESENSGPVVQLIARYSF